MNISDYFELYDSKVKFTSGEEDILMKNHKFFSFNVKYINILLDIIQRKSNMSIRLIDWFPSNYSKKYNIFYGITDRGKKKHFYVYNEYKNQLNGYSKDYFDPFCRKRKIIYNYRYKNEKGTTEEIKFITSIGQLNFFQWAIRNRVLKYIENNLEKIDKDMKETIKHNNELKRMAEMEQIEEDNEIHSDDETEDDKNPDPLICSSESMNTLIISPSNKTSSTHNSTKKKRNQLSKSVYESGIKQSNVRIRLDFD